MRVPVIIAGCLQTALLSSILLAQEAKQTVNIRGTDVSVETEARTSVAADGRKLVLQKRAIVESMALFSLPKGVTAKQAVTKSRWLGTPLNQAQNWLTLEAQEGSAIESLVVGDQTIPLWNAPGFQGTILFGPNTVQPIVAGRAFGVSKPSTLHLSTDSMSLIADDGGPAMLRETFIADAFPERDPSVKVIRETNFDGKGKPTTSSTWAGIAGKQYASESQEFQGVFPVIKVTLAEGEGPAYELDLRKLTVKKLAPAAPAKTEGK